MSTILVIILNIWNIKIKQCLCRESHSTEGTQTKVKILSDKFREGGKHRMRREDRAEVPSSAQGGTGSGFLEKAVPSVLMDEQTLVGREKHFR